MPITATSPSGATALDPSTAPELPESELRILQALDHFWEQVDQVAQVYHAGQMLPNLLGQFKVSAQDAQLDISPSTPTLNSDSLLSSAKSPLLIAFLDTCRKRYFGVESRPESFEGKQYLAISVNHPKL